MLGKLIFFQFHQPQLVKKELYRGPVTVTIDKQNFGTGLERQVLQVQGLVYWSTGCNLRNFPSPALLPVALLPRQFMGISLTAVYKTYCTRRFAA